MGWANWLTGNCEFGSVWAVNYPKKGGVVRILAEFVFWAFGWTWMDL
jgi:hypothetical protein